MRPRFYSAAFCNTACKCRSSCSAIPQRVIREIEALATSTDLSIRQIQSKIAGRASRGIVGEITKRARAGQPTVL
jgi:hypothetical protein